MIAVGSEAPDFKLASQFGTEYSLSQFKGDKNVMLVFYPKDWTYTWSREMPSIESMIDQFNAVDTQVLGVSIDSKESHDNWAKSLGGISFPLLQDFHPKGEMATSYGTYLENKGFAARSTVIVDKQGSVRYSVMANGERIITELLAECQKING
jgi:alkyl hydroperoxide reductase subunit AhpC